MDPSVTTARQLPPPRLAVFDLDGTLLRTGQPITPQAAQHLAALVADGLPCALASARPDASVAVVAGAVGVELPRISYNGAQVRLADGTLSHQVDFTVGPALGQALARLTATGALHLYLTDGRWLAWGDPTAIAREEHDTWCTADAVGRVARPDELTGQRCLKVLLEGPADAVTAVQQAVDASDGLNLSHSGMGLHDIWPRASGKGNALRALCGALGLPTDAVVACGDSDTDLPLVQAAGRGVAVAPGSDALQQVADRVVAGPGSDELFATVRELAGLAQRRR